MNHAPFDRDFFTFLPVVLGALLAFMGAWMALRPQEALGVPNIRLDGMSPNAQERLRAAIDRRKIRKIYESVGDRPVRVAAVITMGRAVKPPSNSELA